MVRCPEEEGTTVIVPMPTTTMGRPPDDTPVKSITNVASCGVQVPVTTTVPCSSGPSIGGPPRPRLTSIPPRGLPPPPPGRPPRAGGGGPRGGGPPGPRGEVPPPPPPPQCRRGGGDAPAGIGLPPAGGRPPPAHHPKPRRSRPMSDPDCHAS